MGNLTCPGKSKCVVGTRSMCACSVQRFSLWCTEVIDTHTLFEWTRVCASWLPPCGLCLCSPLCSPSNHLTGGSWAPTRLFFFHRATAETSWRGRGGNTKEKEIGDTVMQTYWLIKEITTVTVLLMSIMMEIMTIMLLKTIFIKSMAHDTSSLQHWVTCSTPVCGVDSVHS